MRKKFQIAVLFTGTLSFILSIWGRKSYSSMVVFNQHIGCWRDSLLRQNEKMQFIPCSLSFYGQPSALSMFILRFPFGSMLIFSFEGRVMKNILTTALKCPIHPNDCRCHTLLLVHTPIYLIFAVARFQIRWSHTSIICFMVAIVRSGVCSMLIMKRKIIDTNVTF